MVQGVFDDVSDNGIQAEHGSHFAVLAMSDIASPFRYFVSKSSLAESVLLFGLALVEFSEHGISQLLD